ncbi:MAG: hypothetical protein ACR2QO_18685 [Acidimicrobiales bacterium]
MYPVAPPVDGQDWLNTRPIGLGSLRGNVVVVVFWSFGCEASLLRVRQVEAMAADPNVPLRAIAVHTPRFPYEESTEAVRDAVAQHHIQIPVVNDPGYETWNAYNPEGWPATVVINARGRVLGTQGGSGDVEVLRETIALGLQTVDSPTVDPAAVNEPSESSSTQTSAIASITGPATVERLPLPDGDLAFPTSVAILGTGELIVADYGNDRLLAFRLSADMRRATALAEIGGFDRPYGLLADGYDGLYVTEPAVGSVSYLDLRAKSRRLLTEDLVAPTGLALDSDESVVVADSGSEQLYRLINEGPHTVTMGLIAGSGVSGSHDGSAADADLAQPTGLARTEVGVVFCDAAASNVRLLTDSGKVATITGNGFFDWGLVDGPAHKAKLQRPSDLAVLDDGSIVIVDTGNNRLRRLTGRRIRTLGLAGLKRPTGICRTDSGQLIVADTGNSRLVVIDADLQTARPLRLDGVLPAARDVAGSRERDLV